jgi:DNA-binding NarL/FixJ family response regulator
MDVRPGVPHCEGGSERRGVLMSTIRVAIVDDHAMVAESLMRLLEGEGDIKVVALAVSVAGAVEAARRSQPDVVVMDYNLPDGDGVSATTRIRAESPRMKVLLLAGSVDSDVAVAAFDAGCVGFIEKTSAVDSLAAAVRSVHAGKTVFASPLKGSLGRAGAAAASGLTRREREVLQLVERGASNQAIATELTVGLSTVQTHVQSILKKLGARSKLEAVAIARRPG